MLALQIPAVGKLGLVETPPPKVGPHDVLVKVVAAGICGTDRHILHGSYPAVFPVIPGHEYAGVVQEVGAAVEGLRRGDHVTVDPNIFCNTCDYCRRGKGHLCENLTEVGAARPGAFAEYSAVPAASAHLVPPDLPLLHAAMTEPVGCALHGMDRAEMEFGDRVVIFGFGPMGAIFLDLVHLAGAREVIVVEPLEGRRQAAARFGADLIINPQSESPEEVIRRKFPHGVEVAIDCSGSPKAIQQALGVIGRGGRVVLFALSTDSRPVEISPPRVLFDEITVRGSCNNPYTHGRAIDLLVNRRVRLDLLITHRFPLAQGIQAFACAGSSETLKVVIEP